MVGQSTKILTVSYGTFSCTLEGFDDPFSTMKAIAEYFRDLAAQDRYFGAEPPQPDPAMLRELAEREVRRRVEAQLEEGGLRLRVPLAAAEPVEAKPLGASPVVPAGTRPDAPAAMIETPAAPTPAPAALAKARDERGQAAVGTANLSPFPAREENRRAAGLKAPPIPTVAQPLRDEDEAIAAISDRLQRIRESVARAHAKASAAHTAEPKAKEPAPEDEALRHESSIEPDAAVDEEPRPKTDGANARPEAVRPAAIELEVAEPEAIKILSQEPPAQPAGTGGQVRPVRRIVIVRSARPASGAAGEAPAQAGRTAIAQPPEPVRAEPSMTQDAFATRASDRTAADAEPRHAPSRPSADTTPPTRAAAAAAHHRTNGEETFAATETLDAKAFSAADSRSPLSPHVEEDGEDQTAPSPAQATEAPTVSFDRFRNDAEQAHAYAATAPRAGESPTAQSAFAPAEEAAVAPKNPGPFNDLADEDELLSSETAPARAAKSITPADSSAQGSGLGQAAEASRPRQAALQAETSEQAVERLMSQTEAELAAAEAKRRQATLTHLKAAVIATRAEEQLTGSKPSWGVDAAAEVARYRADFEQSIRTSPEIGESPRRLAHPPTAETERARPTTPPLILVSELRVDRPTEEGPVVPRRVSLEPMSMESLFDETPVFKAPPGKNFSDFVATLHLTSVIELTEAAAAYLTYVAKLEDFPRPAVMRLVAQVDLPVTRSREALLRAFGTLMRQGILRRSRRGQFELNAGSLFAEKARHFAEA